MNEDSSFKRDQKKEEELCVAPDFSGSLGKGMLAKENIETLGNSSGLTPLSFGVNVRNNSSGLSPLRLSDEIYTRNKKNVSLTPLKLIKDGVFK